MVCSGAPTLRIHYLSYAPMYVKNQGFDLPCLAFKRRICIEASSRLNASPDTYD